MRMHDVYVNELGQELRRGIGLLTALAGLLLAAATLHMQPSAGPCRLCERTLELSVSTP